jgi:hypothetical protein
VSDDGRGIAPHAVSAAQADGHIGLASCSERAEAVGGALLVTGGAAGTGTVARLRVPLAASRPVSPRPEPAPIGGPPSGGSPAPPEPPMGGSREALASQTIRT